MAAVRAGDLSAGIASLRRAYAIRPHPAVLYNIARACHDHGDVPLAIEYFERYLAHEPADAASVEGVVSQLRERLARRAAASRPVRRSQPAERPADPHPAPPPVPPSPPVDEPGAEESSALPAVVERLDAIERRLDELTDAVVDLRTPPEPEPVAAEEPPPPLGLEDKSPDLYELLVVSAARRASSPEDAPAATSIVTDEDIRLSGATQIPDVLRRVPGMETLTMTASDTNLAVRGFNQRLSNKLLVLLNGRSVYLDFLGATWWRMLPIQLEDIERVEVIRGPGSTLYGANAFGGVVNILTRPPGERRTQFVVAGGSGGTVRAAHLFGGREGNLGYRASVGYERTDRWAQPLDESRPDYTRGRPPGEAALDVSRFDAELRWVGSKDTRFGISGGLAHGGHQFYALGVFRSFWSEGLLGYVMADGAVGPVSVRGFVNHLDVSSRPEYHPTGGPTLATDTFADVADVEAVYSAEFDLLARHDLDVGVGYRFKRIDWSYLDGLHSEHHLKSFVEDRIALHERVDATLGVRVDQHPLVGLTPSPRGALVYHPVDTLALRITGSTAFRTPTFLESYLGLAVPSPVSAISVVSQGDRDLEPERIAQLDFGATWAATDWLSTELVGYAQQVSNLIQLGSPVMAGAPGFDLDLARRPESGTFLAGVSSFENGDRVYRGGGLEVSAHLLPMDGVDVKASYVLQAVWDTQTGARYQGNPMQKAHAGLQIRTLLGLDIGADIQYVSPLVIPEREFDPVTRDIRINQCQSDRYMLLNGRVGYRLLDDDLELAVSAFNMLGPLLSDAGLREHCFADPLGPRATAWISYRFGE